MTDRVYNTGQVTSISADGGEKTKRTEKKIGARGQFATRGKDFVSATVTVDSKTKKTTSTQKYGVGLR